MPAMVKLPDALVVMDKPGMSDDVLVRLSVMTVVSVHERLLEDGAPLPVHVVAPCRTVLAGALHETCEVQVQVPAGMTTVSPDCAAFIAACTSPELQDAAVRVVARIVPLKRALKRSPSKTPLVILVIDRLP